MEHSRSADGVVLLVFAALALAYTASVWCGTTPYVGLAGDAANIATFVAARAHPELFPRDPVLADPQNYRFYATIHLPLIRALGAIVGSYGTAFLLLLPLHAWFQLTGFYALGMALFASRPWAVVLAAANAVTLHLPLGEIWGLWPDALPRVTFQALLPFLLAAACRWRSQPRAWPWLMLAMGALTYVHPVSFPAWALAIWLGFWPFLPAGWRVHERAACLVLLGLVCSAVAAPFAWLYVSSFETGVKPPEIVAMWTRALFVSFRDAPGATAEFVGVLWTLGLAPCALVAAAVVARASQPDRSKLALVACWIVGLLIVSSLLPMADQAVARAQRGLPRQVDLIRGLRYLVPLLLTICVWALAVLQRRADALRWLALLALPLGLGWQSLGRGGTLDRIAAWDARRRAGLQLVEALDAVASLPRGSLVLPRAEGLAIRYHALRPVLFTEKDMNVLLYANHRELPLFLQRRERIRGIRSLNSPIRELGAWVALGVEWEVDYLLLDFPVHPAQIKPGSAERVWGNPGYTLLRIPGRQ